MSIKCRFGACADATSKKPQQDPDKDRMCWGCFENLLSSNRSTSSTYTWWIGIGGYPIGRNYAKLEKESRWDVFTTAMDIVRRNQSGWLSETGIFSTEDKTCWRKKTIRRWVKNRDDFENNQTHPKKSQGQSRTRTNPTDKPELGMPLTLRDKPESVLGCLYDKDKTRECPWEKRTNYVGLKPRTNPRKPRDNTNFSRRRI